MGHNETAVRLNMLAHDAQAALDRVARSETDAIDGWLAYGAALNEGRAMFPGKENDRAFGEWVRGIMSPNLGDIPHDDDRAAAMWAAANPDQFDEARAAGKARTVRGVHAKWNEINAKRDAEAKAAAAEEARKEAEAKAKAEAQARRLAQEARDEEERKAAEARAEEAAQAKAEADKAVKKADAEAKKAAKKADKVGADGPDNVRGTQGTGDNEWYTPQEHIERARRVMGGFDVDPASNPIAQEHIGASHFFTEETNGLEQEWNGRVWLNPPYAQPLIGEFMSKLRDEVAAGRCDQAIALTHNYTDTKWFQETARAASAICFTRGRIKFYSPSGDIAAPTQGQAFFYFGPDVDAFCREFAEVGFVVEVRHE